MKKIWMLIVLIVFTVLSCGGGNSSSGGSNEIVFMIWDRGQEKAMSAIAREFEKENPGVKVKIQVTGWDEYWKN